MDFSVLLAELGSEFRVFLRIPNKASVYCWKFQKTRNLQPKSKYHIKYFRSFRQGLLQAPKQENDDVLRSVHCLSEASLQQDRRNKTSSFLFAGAC